MAATRPARSARRSRRAWGVGLALAALVGGVGLTAASSPSDPTARPQFDPAPQALSVGWVGGLGGNAPCPEGYTRTASLRQDTFVGGIPWARFNNGWTSIGGGTVGNAARSSIGSGSSATSRYFYLPYVETTVGRRTMLAFAQKGDTPGGWHTKASVNGLTFNQNPRSGWTGRVHDITAATDDEGGALGARFENRRPSSGTSQWDLSNVQLYTCGAANLLRLGGDDRYDTAVAVSREFNAGRDTVFVASGETFPDALGGAAAAARFDDPLLLVQKGRIPSSVRAELERLQPERIIVVGGPTTISAGVRQQLEGYASSGEARRVGGANRYETATAISREFYDEGLDTVYVATGVTYPDALTGSALAGRESAPVLFTQQDEIPTTVRAELERLQPERIVVLGGPQAVSESVRVRLRNYTTGDVVDRISGADRYETAERVSRQFGTGKVRAYVATGTDYPDALSISARAGSQDLPVLLAKPDDLTGSTRTALNRLDPARGVVVGGGNVLYSIVLDQLGRYTP